MLGNFLFEKQDNSLPICHDYQECRQQRVNYELLYLFNKLLITCIFFVSLIFEIVLL